VIFAFKNWREQQHLKSPRLRCLDGAGCKYFSQWYKFISEHLPLPSSLLIYICASKSAQLVTEKRYAYFPHRGGTLEKST
jgi:hypothetical protein